MNQPALPARRSTAAPQNAAVTLTPNELVPVLLEEAKRNRTAIAAIFTGVALLTLVIGLLVLPKNYTASTTILAQESDIIQPLLEGRAVATEVVDRAGIARQVIYSQKVLQEALKTGGWLDNKPSAIEQDRLMESIKGRIAITSPRPNLVQISYRDNDAKRTYDVTERLGALFISESLAAKERESREAYEFIDSRVTDYHAKLTDAENNLRLYRSANVDAQPGSATDSNTRISALRTQLENTDMSLLEQRSRAGAINAQLSGESAVTAVATRETYYRGQMMELQGQLDRLLLNYTEQHPDVVRVRHQMEDLQTAMQAEQQRRAQGNANGNSPFDDTQINPLYQELRSQQATTQREVAATESRRAITESMLGQEMNRSRRIAESESELAELTRDYEVNRDIYQDLLRRRENARVSMELDREERGLTLRVQDPATMPLRPTGLRFLHFAIAGLFVAIALPLGLLFLRARFDPRIRSAAQLQKTPGLVLLSSVPAYPSPQDRRAELKRNALSIAMLVLVVLAYALAFGLKQLAAA
ncbi:XrtA system polysaccharide chain length determinant [Pseudoxanthomonas indica]|uniref:Polysaccharide chain length determinant protein, PEP-CTERM locus subfamily n=1 Tax=Pseudoxanthomonas indica TaxID=428993 RepID=A0A1T5J1I3_9GAMM|nr:XrtA system polysaccharide chain length determinant [Pseudoxanthomonas indica]GGD55701.1 chain-length determining protein [Pseudoxanthomonas indica]SKC45236.1 polysaccharide chain length determinant protein, PEP-CTERM locus subfamily [Pseudoxanthomonas indica]